MTRTPDVEAFRSRYFDPVDNVVPLDNPRQPSASQLASAAARFPEVYHSSLRATPCRESARPNPSPSTGARKDGIYSEQLRLHRQQHHIGIACITLSVLCVIYMVAQLARAVF